MAHVFTGTGYEVNIFTRFIQKLKPDMEAHKALRQEAIDTLSLAQSVRGKRQILEQRIPIREFPVASLIDRRNYPQ